ncbi:Nucleolar MIF4G domain-containing protein 1 [Camellia lanceoleosa]|uniref:Nucleolar MIF4G domain-containing protein 1 n=1 Tax=Camellia lanceoleosa TaxID=1840588 RepID=A0ACC0FX10_9ERIC|nr:Nucleolar MIF4G domain-containing protein 1 [Camellia lanceoleosa]
MAVDNKLGQKSRKERRKEARLTKNKKKFDSWIENQEYRKLKKISRDSNPKNVKKSQNSSIGRPKGREVLQIEPDYERDISTDEPAMLKTSEAKLDFLAFPNHTTEKIIERNKGLKKDSKSKFEEFLKMEIQQDVISAEEDCELEKKLAKKLRVKDGKLRGVDDGINMLFEGIPSVIDFFEEEPNPVPKEILKKRSKNSSASKKRKKSMSLEKEPELGSEMAVETVVGLSKPAETCYEIDQSTEQPTKLKKSKTKLDSSKNTDSVAVKMVKKKKTKFEEYLEMETQQDGIPSVLDSFETEDSLDDEASRKSFENSSSCKKFKKIKTSEQEPEAEMASDTEVVVSEPVETFHAKMPLEKILAKAPQLDRNTKYVAPHLRSRVEKESEEFSQIRRRVRGLLNRMSESNVESVTSEISTIFHSVARHVGSQVITEEVLASCSGGPRGNEQYAAVFAAFVAGMTSLVGMDFGAKLLASLAKCFEDEYLEEDNLSLRNVTLLLSYLYIFGVCSSDLIYDFMIMLSKRLMEIDVSTILTILQCCGMNLRGDDPAAMKDFVLSVQNRANELKASSGNGQADTSSKRMEFMLETIFDIKNNKKRAKEDTPQHTRIKKWLQKLRVEGILIRGLKWSKLVDPDKKGQWWLSGDIAQKLLQLAAVQRMNTDVRRAIFCVIMSGEDYVDAFEKLLRSCGVLVECCLQEQVFNKYYSILAIKLCSHDKNHKITLQIMRVLVECCLQEQVFNKYYSILAIKLCSHDKNHKITLQYCLWDHFKELESMQLMRSMHLSKFVAEMVTSFTLSLAVLKAIDFSDTTQLTPKRIKHFQMLFEAIFEHPDSLVWNVFTRIAASPEYESLRNGVEFFINKYVVGNEKSLVRKFKIAKKAFTNIEGVLM